MVAWQLARELSKRIHSVACKSPFNRDFGLRDQIERAAVSTCSNSAEGLDRHGNQEFIHFLSVAKSSAAETRSCLYVAHDRGYITDDDLNDMKILTFRIAAAVYSLIRYLNESEIRGDKFRQS